MNDQYTAAELLHPVLLFDGTCVLCNAFFQWIVKKDKDKKISFATLQSDFGQTILKKNLFVANADSVVLVQDDQTYIFSEAALRTLILLGGIYSWIGHLGLIFPKFIRDSMYKFIARNRYRWFGQKACMIPDKELRNRFMDVDSSIKQ